MRCAGGSYCCWLRAAACAEEAEEVESLLDFMDLVLDSGFSYLLLD